MTSELSGVSSRVKMLSKHSADNQFGPRLLEFSNAEATRNQDTCMDKPTATHRCSDEGDAALCLPLACANRMSDNFLSH